jgi:hypothetical protein
LPKQFNVLIDAPLIQINWQSADTPGLNSGITEWLDDFGRAAFRFVFAVKWLSAVSCEQEEERQGERALKERIKCKLRR